MKKLSILFLSLVALATTVTSCSKNDNNTPAPAATALELTIKDDSQAIVGGASVQLYSDSGYSVKVGTPLLSDATTGKVTFTGLSSKIYYFDATKGCKTNFLSQSVTVDSQGKQAAIPANTTTKMNVNILDTAFQKFTNTSTNYWVLTVGSTPLFPIAGGVTDQVYPIPAGTYAATLVEYKSDLSGPTGTAPVAINIDLTCGSTSTSTISVP